MSALLIEGLSPAAIARLTDLAAKHNRTVAEEGRERLEELLTRPGVEGSAIDLPYESTGVTVRATDGGKRWPGPVYLGEEVSIPSIHPWPGETFTVQVTDTGLPRLPDPASVPTEDGE